MDSFDPSSVPTISIISSHSISKKTTRCLATLFPIQPPTTPSVLAVAIVAKSTVASKAITIAEIVKRRISTQGEAWFQYTKLEGTMVELKAPKKSKKEGKGKNKDQKDSQAEKTGEKGTQMGEEREDTDEEDPFEALKEKAPQKKRMMPLLTIYISRSPIPELARLYGEQSGGSPVGETQEQPR
ncbi:hypothetical protein HOY80DRAFT_894776 [Tuber brumale]|nr:hypothetical protein HOY80DRAFT_894776 [Tuber brumale]